MVRAMMYQPKKDELTCGGIEYMRSLYPLLTIEQKITMKDVKKQKINLVKQYYVNLIGKLL